MNNIKYYDYWDLITKSSQALRSVIRSYNYRKFSSHFKKLGSNTLLPLKFYILNLKPLWLTDPFYTIITIKNICITTCVSLSSLGNIFMTSAISSLRPLRRQVRNSSASSCLPSIT